MDADVVPDDDDGPPDVLQQVQQELADLSTPDVAVVDLKVEPHATAARADRDAGDHRQSIMPVEVPDDRRDSAGRPSPSNRRDQEEPRFVDEDEVGAQPRGVFFTRGHSFLTHRRMRVSFRSLAWRSGFCGLQPI